MEPLSASDLERYGYCPLSWWLGRENEVTSDELREGKRKHEAIARELTSIQKHEARAKFWEMLVIIFALVATGLAVIGLSLTPIDNARDWSNFLGGISVLWILAATFMLVRSTSVEKSKLAFYERMIVVFAIVGTLVAINSISILGVEPEAALLYEMVALLCLIGACIAIYVSISAGRKAKIHRDEIDVEGRIEYVDKDGSRLLRSERYGLSGRPDYIIEVEGESIPVEVKTGRKPRGPLFSHIMQVAAYCLLLSEEKGERVSHGILSYEKIEHEIEYSEELEALLHSKMREMRNLISTGEVHRNHHREGKCRNCSRRDICPERLV